MNNIGDAIKGARKKAHLTQIQLAKHLKVSQTTITHWEHGTNVPNVATLQEISKLTETTFASLFGTGGMHAVHSEVTYKGIKRVANKSVPWEIEFGEDVLLVYISIDNGEWSNGDIAVFRAEGTKPSEISNGRYLLQGYGDDIECGLAEAHPTIQGSYRCIDHNLAYISPYIKVRSAHRLVAWFYGNEKLKMVKTKLR